VFLARRHVEASNCPPDGSTTVSVQATLFRNPLFRWGMPAATAAIIVAVAFLLVEDRTLRLAMLGVAALDFVVTPQILKRAARAERTPAP
jgi:hypothetical protein